MKFIKKIIIAMLVIILLLMLILALSMISQNKKEEEKVTQDVGEIIINEEETTQKVTDFVKFYTVKSCITTYLNTINTANATYYGRDENNNYTLIVNEEEINEKIYSLLSTEYIENNNISINNINEYVQKLQEDVIFVPLKMNVLKADETEKYAVYGFITDANYKFIKELYIIVNLDISNKVFSIEPIKDGQYDDIDKLKLVNDNKTIEENDNNTITEAKVNYEYIIKDYVNSFKILMLSQPKKAYEYLDEEYRQKRFGSYEEFYNYLSENYNYINTLNMQKYQVNDYDDYSEYILIDSLGNYYRFKETGIMEFTVMLDVYTVDLPQFIEQYNSANDEEKIQMNIEKFIQMINAKDYKSAYKLLNENFRQTNFPSVNDFENYIKQQFFEFNLIEEIEDIEKSGSYYISNILISDNNDNTQTKNKTIIIALGNNTDFTMSFKVE